MSWKSSKKMLLQKLLKGIETGDPESAAVVNEEKYIQHNPQTHEGSEGLASLFARLSKTNPKVTFVRVFEDGDFAFAHNEYDFADLKVAFEVFRFEQGKAVEHWDNIQPMKGPNPSARTMLGGSDEINDLEDTEKNRELARNFVEHVLVSKTFSNFSLLVAEDLIQHNPDLIDGAAAYQDYLEEMVDTRHRIDYRTLHRVLAEGNFTLCISEGYRNNIHTSFYDLFRFEDGKIVQHWDTIETIAPKSEWKNNNGKF